MPPSKRDPLALMIFMRGRWRSVPPGSGFAVARRGRLQELNSGTVHSALRRLRFGMSSKARLGPRLSFKKIPPSGGENSDEDVTQTETKQITQHNTDVRPCKRTRDTSSEEPVQSVTTVATVHAAKHRKTSKNHQSHLLQQSSSESKSSEKSKTQTYQGILIKSPKKNTETSKTDLRYQKSKEIMSSPKKSSMSLKILLDSPKKSKPVDQTNSKKSSPILESKDLSEKISRYLQSRSRKQNEHPKKGNTIISDSDFETDQSEILKSKKKQKHSLKKINSHSNSDVGGTNEKSLKNLKKFHKIGPKRRKIVQDSSESQSPQKAENIFQRLKDAKSSERLRTSKELDIDEHEENPKKFHKIGPKRRKLVQASSESQSPQKAENIFQRPNEAKSSQRLRAYKELDIDERDIELLRNFLQNRCSDADLLKFDADDEFKKKIFYQINPLVKIEWCPIIDRMLRRSQDSQITLTDFASNLGLRSVNEVASIKIQRYKIRKRKEKSNVDINSDSTSEDKENNEKMPRRTEKTTVLKERKHNGESNSENKVKESKNKVSNKIVVTRKRADSDSEESKAKENNKKAGSAKEIMTKPNLNAIDSDSEASDAKENNKKVTNTKKLTKSEECNEKDSDLEASNTKSNNKKVGRAKKQTTKPNLNTIDSNSRKGNAKSDNQKEIDETVELSSERETEKSVKAVKKTAKAKPVISSKRKRTHPEYSTLEDHAIVAWVSNGSRASRVNGNLLWRQLQDQYMQITGSRRTWHSLRNRYLRYILPKLGNLALPLSQQTRLRAAAATGEIKGRKARSPRRNSIFTLPPRGAASRRPNAVDDSETDNQELPSTRSPRYSSLTRRFARRQNLARPSSELSENSLRSNKLEVTEKKPEAKGNSTKEPRRLINSPHKKPNGNSTRNDHSDSDKRSESPRRDKDSSDSSSESENESKKTNEPRRTRPTANDANKRMSRNDTRENVTESKRLTRQSNIQDGSDESKSLKSRSVADKQNSTKEKTNESPSRNLIRHKTPSEQNSNESVSRSKSPESNRRRSRQITKKYYESDDKPNATNNEQSDSDEQSESPRRENDSSDSSSESENESKETNEPRRNKRMSRNEIGKNANESKRLTRQSNIQDGPDESKSLKSRSVADKQNSTKEKTNESPSRNLIRHKTPSEQNSNDSNESVSRSKSPERNRRRSRRDTKNNYESDDKPNESKRRKSPIRSNTRKLNRNTSPSKQSSKGSNTSVRQVRRKSKSPIKRNNTPDDSSGKESDSSSGSVSELRRRSNRINSLNDRSNRHKSNRLISPIKQNGRLSSDSSRRKSSRLTPNESINKRRHSSESKRKSKLAKRDSLDLIVASDSSESFMPKKVKKDLKKRDDPKKTVVQQKMRRLFNPKAML